jgi:thiamine transport system ATP-binding protein
VSSSRPLLEVSELSAAWDRAPVLRSVTLTVADGEYFVLLGPNGSGKTTLLRCIAGLERPTSGCVALDGREITDLPTHRRGVGLMFQDAALFPNRTVYENIAYAPLLQRRPRAEIDDEVGRLVDLLRLGGFEDRSPEALSGGERQRVALARTLAARPRLVLLDEPFASIDVELKAGLRGEFRRVLGALGIAAIHVTHDREEGLFLGDRVGLLFGGVLDTVGSPGEVFRHPRSAHAARFLGYNVLQRDGAELAIDPRDLCLGPPDGPGVALTVEAVGSVGRESVAILATAEGERVEARWAGAVGSLAPGQRVSADWTTFLLLPPSKGPGANGRDDGEPVRSTGRPRR